MIRLIQTIGGVAVVAAFLALPKPSPSPPRAPEPENHECPPLRLPAALASTGSLASSWLMWGMWNRGYLGLQRGSWDGYVCEQLRPTAKWDALSPEQQAAVKAEIGRPPPRRHSQSSPSLSPTRHLCGRLRRPAMGRA
jgi:hypothetical protein